MFLDSIFPTRRGILSTLVLGILILSIAIVVVIIVGEISKIKQRNSYFNEANMGVTIRRSLRVLESLHLLKFDQQTTNRTIGG